jgi:UDPglucose 6-dehydrogenase
MRIGFIGVGKLGRDAAEVMSENHFVEGYDVSHVEPTNFKMVDTIQDVCNNKEIIFVAVPTPHHPDYDGRYPTSHLEPRDFNYEIVKDVLNEINQYTTKEQLVVLISTVLPGTIRDHFIPLVKNYRFIYNPYLIAMGTVKWDMVNPEMIIIGTEDGTETGDAKLLLEFYKTFITDGTRYEIGTWDDAEAIKIFYNTFISTKVGLVNMIQDVAEKNGNMNVDVVTGALERSTKRIISKSYMKAGMGDGGGCVKPDFKINVNDKIITIEELYNVFHNNNDEHKIFLVDSANYTCNTKQQKKIFDVTTRKYKGKIYTITTKTNKKITLTPDHIIPIERNGERILIRVEEIKLGDKLYVL